MPLTQSAIKALRRDRRRRKTNLLTQNKARQAVKKARKRPTRITIASAARLLDRAAKKKIIHKNKAARLKSRLAKATPPAKTSKKTKKKSSR